ncbi:MAG TPA: hypothetical protein VF266_27330, partial [Thermoanaerobaculia bacterium]
GEGVVGACRLTDDAKAGGVLLGNLAYEEIPDDQWRDLFSETRVKSKDLQKDMHATAWELKTSSFPFQDAPKIQAICENAWAESTFDFEG